MDNSIGKVKSLSPKSPTFKIPSPKASIQPQPQIQEPEKEEEELGNVAWKMDFAISDNSNFLKENQNVTSK